MQDIFTFWMISQNLWNSCSRRFTGGFTIIAKIEDSGVIWREKLEVSMPLSASTYKELFKKFLDIKLNF